MVWPVDCSCALSTVDVDYCLPVTDLATTLVAIVEERVIANGGPDMHVVNGETRDLAYEVRVSTLDGDAIGSDDPPGNSSPFGCPECGGVLWEQPGSVPPRFRCRVGHAYTAETLLASHEDGYETALWTALRTLEEKSALASRLAGRARGREQHPVVARFEARQDATDHAARVIRSLLSSAGTASGISALGTDAGVDYHSTDTAGTSGDDR